GINLETEEVEDMIEEKVIEPLRVKKQALQSATELTDMVLLIDDVVASKGGEEGEQPPSPGGAPGGPAGMPGGGGGLPPGLG
ncbi:MAG: TCP-1/cpn60 chaperonin family protein, partial [Thermoplasmatota archaeon]